MCEQRVGVWDNYASQVLVQADGTFPWRGLYAGPRKR
jgi:hypothetical protein